MAKSFFCNFEKRESAKKIWRNFQTSAAACCDVPTVVEPCEKPTPTGWSMKSLCVRAYRQRVPQVFEPSVSTYTFETSFQAFGFSVTPLLSFVMRQGPSSWNRPIILELPGYRSDSVSCGGRLHFKTTLTPPLSQMESGAVSGFLRAAKNQNLCDRTSTSGFRIDLSSHITHES